jgi:hypothetical protein
MSRAPGKYVAGAMVPAGAALDRPGTESISDCNNLQCSADSMIQNIFKSSAKSRNSEK